MECVLEARNISYSYGKTKVLDKVSLQMKKGEILGMLGPSGAGKTTLVNLLTGQRKPEEGEIRVQGKPLGAGGKPHAGFRAGIMMDSLGLYERLSVWENLKIFAGLYRVPEKRIRELLNRVKLEQAEKTAVFRLSKGMRSRVNFCRALLLQADILYLDEPTSGLDPVTARELHSLILEEKQAGTAVCLTTHNMQEAAKLCGEILLLHQGRIIERGGPKEICMRYNELNSIEIVLKNGEIILLENSKESAKRLFCLMREERIASLHSSEPDLEKVFLKLTGRGLEGP